MQRTATRLLNLHWQPYSVVCTNRPIHPHPEVGGSDDYDYLADVAARRTAVYGEPHEAERVVGVMLAIGVLVILGIWKLADLVLPLLARLFSGG